MIEAVLDVLSMFSVMLVILLLLMVTAIIINVVETKILTKTKNRSNKLFNLKN
jgi:biopolymer transport protein ExbD